VHLSYSDILRGPIMARCHCWSERPWDGGVAAVGLLCRACLALSGHDGSPALHRTASPRPSPFPSASKSHRRRPIGAIFPPFS
jgi:hypothetical protein